MISIEDYIKCICPVIYFHEKEKYFPTTVKNMIESCELVDNQTVVYSHDELKVEHYLVESLYQPGMKKSDNLKLIIKNEDIYNNKDGEKEIQCMFSDPFEFQGQKYMYIVFFLLFGYNGTLGPHEIDFEYITFQIKLSNYEIVMSQSSQSSQSSQAKSLRLYKPVIHRIYTSSHGNGRWYNPVDFLNQEKKPFMNNIDKRIVVFSALESHAFYPKIHNYRRFFGFGNDITGDGVVYDAQQNIVILADPSSQLYQHYFNKNKLHYFIGNYKNQHSLIYRENITNPLTYDGYYKFQGGVNSILQLGEVQKYLPALQTLKYGSFIGSCAIPYLLRNEHFAYQYINFITLFMAYFLFFFINLS
jgi:hypothetical protein